MKYGAYLPRNILDDEDEIGARVDAALGIAPTVTEDDPDAAPITSPVEEFVYRSPIPREAPDRAMTPGLSARGMPQAPPVDSVPGGFSPMETGYAPRREQPMRAVPASVARDVERRTIAAQPAAPAPQAPATPAPAQARPEGIVDPWEAVTAPAAAPSAPTDDTAPITASQQATEADDSDDAPVARPVAMPASTAMPGDENKRAKLRSSDAFGATQDEQSQLADAQHGDQRSDRWRRALQGIGGIVGVLGAAAGNGGMAGLGMASMMGARSVRPHNERTDAVREQIAARVAAAQGERQYMDTQDERAAASARQASQDARQATLDEANLGLVQARTQAQQSAVEDDAFERASAAGDAAGMREAIRATVNGLNDNSGLANQWRAMVSSPEFDQMSSQSLRDFQGTIGQLVNNRRSGLLSGGGGTGPRQALDGAGNIVNIPGRPAQRGQGAPPAATGAPVAAGEAIPVQAPTRPARAGRPRAAAVPAVADTPENRAVAQAEDPVLSAIMRRHPDMSLSEAIIVRGAAIEYGLTPANVDTPDGQMIVAARLQAYREGGSHDQTEALREAGSAAASRLNPTRLAQGLDQRVWNRVSVAMTRAHEEAVAPYVQAASALRRAIANHRSPADRARIVAAMHGDARAAAAMGVPNLQAMIAAGNEAYGRQQSGAAISQSEWQQFRTILGQGSSWASPEVALNAFNNMIGMGRNMVDGRALQGGGTPAYAEEFWRQRRAIAEAREARLHPNGRPRR